MSPADPLKQDDSKPGLPPARKATGLGLILSIVVTLGGLSWALPRLVEVLDHPLAKLVFILYFIPLLPTFSAILQGQPGATWPALPWIYVSEALSLLFEVLFVLLVLPLVFVNMLAVLAAGLSATLGIILILMVLQLAAGWDLGVHVPTQDQLLYGVVWLGLTAAAILLWALYRWTENQQDTVSDLFRRRYLQLRQRIGLDRLDAGYPDQS